MRESQSIGLRDGMIADYTDAQPRFCEGDLVELIDDKHMAAVKGDQAIVKKNQSMGDRNVYVNWVGLTTQHHGDYEARKFKFIKSASSVGIRTPVEPGGTYTVTEMHIPGAKDDGGKTLAAVLGDFGLGLKQVAEIGTFGANKYSRKGWEHVEDAENRYNDAMWRHLLELNGDINARDPEHGKRHLAAVAWNALALLTILERKNDAKGT